MTNIAVKLKNFRLKDIQTAKVKDRRNARLNDRHIHRLSPAVGEI